jgi:2-oxoisovalerate ferredoxin oxidoreductase beta subunit
MSSYTVTHEKAKAFYPLYERKGELQHQTHYCPGCGHGITHKLLARAIDELGIQDRTIIVSPVGCSVFAYYYFDTGNVQVAHGRAPAVATALRRATPGSIVISYQGDGDLAAIGTAEIIHAANRGENITVIFVNNAIYGMTGGQMAPTTPVGAKSTTSPFGRNVWNEGYPVHVCELLAALDAPVYLERVSLADNKSIMNAGKAIKRGLENQVKGLGFSLIEVVSPCPTIWKMEPVNAQRRVRDELVKLFVPGVYRDRTKEAEPRPAQKPPVPLAEIPKVLDIANGNGAVRTAAKPARATDMRIKVAGFGGQGILMLGALMAEAGLDAGLEVSWLPSYGPEMRSGTSNCHVRLSDKPIDSPLVSKPNVLLAFNEPSLEKFFKTVEPGGWVLYNDRKLPDGYARTDVNVAPLPFTEIADGLGDPKAGNIVMLGALLELTNILTAEQVDDALRRKVKSQRWLELDRKAIEAGREAARNWRKA